MSNQTFRILGDVGPCVVLLPGGGEGVEGFFPGLAEGLMSDPGCRIVLYDRPGVGTNTSSGSLAGASEALHALVRETGLGPVVLVGQSLGGAVAALLARDHPKDVAGMVLLDPSLVNDVRVAKTTERGAALAAIACHVPFIERFLRSRFRSYGNRLADRHVMRSDVRVAFAEAAALDIPRLYEAVQGLAAIAKDFRESDLPRVPSAVVTADRKATSRISIAHGRLAKALGALTYQWSGAVHAVHLTHPVEVLDVFREILSMASADSSDGSEAD